MARSKPNAHIKLPGVDNEFDNSMRPNPRISTKSSGFAANAQLFDETSWKTETNLHTDQIRTEYRNRYNVKKPFHKSCLLNSHGRKPAPERFRVYDTVDMNPNTNWSRKARNHSVFNTQKNPSHTEANSLRVSRFKTPIEVEV
jgi:hypothetical protein